MNRLGLGTKNDDAPKVPPTATLQVTAPDQGAPLPATPTQTDDDRVQEAADHGLEGGLANPSTTEDDGIAPLRISDFGTDRVGDSFDRHATAGRIEVEDEGTMDASEPPRPGSPEWIEMRRRNAGIELQPLQAEMKPLKPGSPEWLEARLNKSLMERTEERGGHKNENDGVPQPVVNTASRGGDAETISIPSRIISGPAPGAPKPAAKGPSSTYAAIIGLREDLASPPAEGAIKAGTNLDAPTPEHVGRPLVDSGIAREAGSAETVSTLSLPSNQTDSTGDDELFEGKVEGGAAQPDVAERRRVDLEEVDRQAVSASPQVESTVEIPWSEKQEPAKPEKEVWQEGDDDLFEASEAAGDSANPDPRVGDERKGENSTAQGHSSGIASDDDELFEDGAAKGEPLARIVLPALPPDRIVIEADHLFEEGDGEGPDGSPNPARSSNAEAMIQGDEEKLSHGDPGIPALPDQTESLFAPPPTSEQRFDDGGDGQRVPLDDAGNPAVETPTSIEPVKSANLFVFDQEPVKLSRDDLNEVLRFAVANKISDTFIQAGLPITGKRYRRLVQLTRRRLTFREVMDLLRSWQESFPGEIQLGGELAFRHSFKIARHERLSFRVAALGCADSTGDENGVEIVFRYIPDQCPTNEDNRVEPYILEHAYPEDGLVLITGPTGSGKSTLLAGLLRHPLTWGGPGDGKRILTFENPIEFNLMAVPNQTGMVRQSEVPRHITEFDMALRNAMRSKPDYILIGETRDRKTTEGIIRGAETGHVCYSTVHTKGVVNTLPRLADEYPPGERWGIMVKLLDNIRLVVHQRLVPGKTDGMCALREYLAFDESFRNLLVRKGPDEYYRLVREKLHAEGCTLLNYARRMEGEGRISGETLSRLERSSTDNEVV